MDNDSTSISVGSTYISVGDLIENDSTSISVGDLIDKDTPVSQLGVPAS